MLKRFEFDVMLIICDGASENRKFIKINNVFQDLYVRVTIHFHMAIFCLSDPNHLMKKLRNNLNSSGNRSASNRFTLLL